VLSAVAGRGDTNRRHGYICRAENVMKRIAMILLATAATAVLGSGATRWRRFSATTAARLQSRAGERPDTHNNIQSMWAMSPATRVRVFEVSPHLSSNPP